MDLTSTFAPITKTTEQEDGSLLVYGKASDGSLDLDDQRCDPAWLDQAMPAWFGTDTGVGTRVGGNIRAQHRSDSAVGKAIEHEVAADGHYITARIVDRDAIAKTKAGVFTGFSIGIRSPKIVKSDLARNGIISGGSIVEVSLVDRPANSNCMLTLCKSATPGMEVNASDFDESRGLVKCEELTLPADDVSDVEKTVTVPSPLNMPGARKAVTTVAEAQAVADETLAKATDTGLLEAPNHSQTCVRCAEPGHLWCAPEGFDKDFAVGLVTETLEKAAGDGSDDESSDIAGAQSAIAIISDLIASEASELATQPSEAVDIRLLLEAVSALNVFINRERNETSDSTCEPAMYLAAEPDVGKKSKYDTDQMAQLLKDGHAMANPNGDPSYPIADAEDLGNAIKAVGRGSGDHDAIRAHIVKRAKALGKADMIPDDWTKTVAPDVEKGRTVTFELDGKSYTATLNDEPTSDDAVKTVAPDEVEVEKAVTPETEEVDTEKTAAPDLVKTLTGALKDETSELRELFKSLLHDDTTAKALTDIGARLERVEQMAAPGGPALRRTGVDVKKSRQSDLLLQAEIEERKAESTYDNDAQQGYLLKARSLRAEAKAIAA